MDGLKLLIAGFLMGFLPTAGFAVAIARSAGRFQRELERMRDTETDRLSALVAARDASPETERAKELQRHHITAAEKAADSIADFRDREFNDEEDAELEQEEAEKRFVEELMSGLEESVAYAEDDIERSMR